jgi:hypothetical protein
MSRVLYTPPRPGDIRSADDINTILTAIASASGDVDQRNFAEEGLDATVFEREVSARRRARVTGSARTAIAAAAAFATIPFVTTGGSGIAVRTAAIGQLAANSVLRIRSRLSFESTVAAGVGIPNDGVRTLVRHVWNDGVSTTKVAGSQKSHRKLTPIAIPLHLTFVWESWLVGPIANIAWIEVQYQRASGITNLDQANLTVDEFRNVEVL